MADVVMKVESTEVTLLYHTVTQFYPSRLPSLSSVRWLLVYAARTQSALRATTTRATTITMLLPPSAFLAQKKRIVDASLLLLLLAIVVLLPAPATAAASEVVVDDGNGNRQLGNGKWSRAACKRNCRSKARNQLRSCRRRCKRLRMNLPFHHIKAPNVASVCRSCQPDSRSFRNRCYKQVCAPQCPPGPPRPPPPCTSCACSSCRCCDFQQWADLVDGGNGSLGDKIGVCVVQSEITRATLVNNGAESALLASLQATGPWACGVVLPLQPPIEFVTLSNANHAQLCFQFMLDVAASKNVKCDDLSL